MSSGDSQYSVGTASRRGGDSQYSVGVASRALAAACACVTFASAGLGAGASEESTAVRSHVVIIRRQQKPAETPKVTVEESPAETRYVTRIEKVPNQRKFAPYAPPAVHSGSPPRPPRHHVLSGHVGEQTLAAEDSPESAAALQQATVAEELLKNAPLLGKIEGASASSKTFREWLGNRLNELIGKSFAPDTVLVMKGRWDHAEHILTDCHIPHRLVDAHSLERSLWSAKILIVNCPGVVSDNLAKRIGNFIEHGGYLLTTDWALDGCLESACPGYAYWDGANSSSQIVDAVAVEPANPLFEHAAHCAPWKLDDKSQLVKISLSKPIHVLVRSRKLSREDPSALGILACTFQFGRGHVLHLVGHFDNNTNLAFQSSLPDPAPLIKIGLRQALALNFVIDALTRKSHLHEEQETSTHASP